MEKSRLHSETRTKIKKPLQIVKIKTNHLHIEWIFKSKIITLY